MSGVEVITPSQVLEAIAYAKTARPEERGLNAFKLVVKPTKPGNSVKYADFKILRKSKTGEWDYVPLNIKFMGLNTSSRVLSPDDPDRKYPGVKLQVLPDSKYSSVRLGPNGEKISVEEPFGAAVIECAKAYKALVLRGLKSREIYNNDNNKISCLVQFERKVGDRGEKEALLGKEIIRMDIKFLNPMTAEEKLAMKQRKGAPAERIIKPDAVPQIKIYNALKKIPETDPRFKKTELCYEELVFAHDDVIEPLTYQNICNMIPYGSCISGVLSMATCTLSPMGIVLQGNLTMLIVKPSQNKGPDPTKVFNEEEINAFADGAIDQSAPLDDTTAQQGPGEPSEFTESTQEPGLDDEFSYE